MAQKVKISNKRRQGMPLLLRKPDGKMRTQIITARSFVIIDESELSQDVADKVARKHITIENVAG